MTDTHTYVAADTMVYLHFQPLDQLDLQRIVGRESVCVIVPRITLQELDNHKNTHQSQRIRERARSRLKLLRRWLDQGRLSAGIDVVFESARPQIDFAEVGLDPQWNDDQLLASLLQKKRNSPGDAVVLLTQDTGLLLTAHTVGMDAVEIPNEYKLSEEVDPLIRENKELRNELVRLQTAQPKPLLRLKNMGDGDTHATYSLTPPPEQEPFDKAGFIQKLREALPPRHPPSRKASPYTSAISVALAPSGNMGGIPKHEYDRYNRDLERYFQAMDEYIDKLAAYRTQPDRTLCLELELRNVGSVPAEDVDIHIHFPDGFALYAEDDIPGRPKEPDEPREPQTEMQMCLGNITAGLAVPSYLDWLGHIGPPDPFSLRRTHNYDLTDHVERLKHGCVYPIRALHLVFPSFDDAGSFNFSYRVTAANLPSPAEGDIHLIVNKAE